MQKRRLGKGLGALISAATSSAVDESEKAVPSVPIAAVRPNRYQPRSNFDPEKIEELKISISEKGVIQPIIVNKRADSEGYELIAGERRLRAAKELGWAEIPCIVKEVDDRELLEIALIENLQRENLNPIEEATAYKQLVNEFNLTQSEAAQKVGKNRSTVTNMLRLLNLPEEIQELLKGGYLSTGHARPLLAIPDAERQVAIANNIVEKGLSVRETEKLIQKLAKKNKKETKSKASVLDSYLQNLEDELQRNFGTKVRIKKIAEDRGKIEISFYSNEDFERLIERLATI